MAVKYDIYATPVPAGSDREPGYHARVVGGDTVGRDELIRNIHRRCTLTEGDIKAALAELGNEMVDCLCRGDNVHLEGIGYFRLSLAAPADIRPGDHCSQDIRIKSVEFRADVTMRKKLTAEAKFELPRHKSHSAAMDIYEIDSLLNDYFDENAFITRRKLEQLCGFTATTAYRHLVRLVGEGRLRNTNTPKNPVYVPVKGYYGK